MSQNFNSLKKQVRDSIDEHERELVRDAYSYHGSTIFSIVATGVATLLPAYGVWIWLAKILAGTTTMLIALDRSLKWGERWIYHRQMKNEYLIVDAKISFYENLSSNLPHEEKAKHYNEIFNDLYTLRRKEILIPGSSTIKLPDVNS